MFLKITFGVYTFLVELICLLLIVFFGILADEGIVLNNFYKAYFLGIQINYQFLYFFILFIFILTIILQIIFVMQSLVKKLN